LTAAQHYDAQQIARALWAPSIAFPVSPHVSPSIPPACTGPPLERLCTLRI
jgi:hypothetical protein